MEVLPFASIVFIPQLAGVGVSVLPMSVLSFQFELPASVSRGSALESTLRYRLIPDSRSAPDGGRAGRSVARLRACSSSLSESGAVPAAAAPLHSCATLYWIT